jgi:transcriptional regulator with AAA-type ATPase domain
MSERDEDSGTRTHSHIWTGAGNERSLSLIAFWDGHVVARALTRGAFITAGRGHDCELFIDHKSVSRQHVRIHFGDWLELEDLGSSNGTLVSGKRLGTGSRTRLEPGQLVGVGAVTLVVQPGAGNVRSYGPVPQSGQAMPWPDEGPMARVAELLRLVARGNISVLLLGETGVGKEVAARALHDASPRSQQPFLPLNCAATPDTLLESELFGHERGAFTGATSAKQGLIEAADGGTLFLDEVGEMPATVQAKLLRLLESGELRRVGSVQPRHVDVRFVSATNRDLAECVSQGTFRQDLFFRLAGIPIEIPPLRQRRLELTDLAHRFAEESAARIGIPTPTISDRAHEALNAHDFPGNIRELKNVIERAVLLATTGRIEARDLALDATAVAAGSSADLRSSVRDFERQRIVDALEATNGNQTAAAKLLEIGRRTLIDKMQAYGIARGKK